MTVDRKVTTQGETGDVAARATADPDVPLVLAMRFRR
jgi:hypothetical protein